MRWSGVVGAGLVVALLGCGGDAGEASSSNAGGSGGASTSSAGTGAGMSSTGTGMEPPPGPSQEGWEQAWAPEAPAVSCGDASGLLDDQLASVTVNETTIVVGFEQVGQNQNPVVARLDGGALIWCVTHETEGPDGRALGLTWNGGDDVYVVYTVVGGGTALEGKGGWLSSYAPGSISGGGPKVTYLGRVAASSGALESGTFVIAVKSDNEVNSHQPSAAPTVLETGLVELLAESAHKPIDADGKTSMDCTDYPFSSRYRFSLDLATLDCADCTNCVSQQPCD